MIRCKIQLHDIGNTCPVCGEQALDARFDERHDGMHFDTFGCDECGILVTYISPDDGRGEYHMFHDGEITVEFDWPFNHVHPEVEESPEARTGFWVNVDGKPAHVQGDPNMSPEEFALLEKMIQAAIKQAEDGTLISDNPDSQT